MIELKKVENWSKAIQAISAFISEGNFRFNDNGIAFKAVDPSQIVLVNYAIPKSAFDEFEVEPTFVGIDLVELNKIMQRILPKDKMLMNVDDNELHIKLEGEISRSFKLPLIDVNDEEINIPATKFDAVIEINARILKEVLKDAQLFGSSVVLRVKGSQLVIEARGSHGNMHALIKETKNLTVKSPTEVVSKYSLNFFVNALREADPAKNVRIELKSDAPMKVNYKIGEGDIQFLLAQMIL